MINLPRSPIKLRRWKRWPTPSILAAVAALFVALGGTALAANSLIHAGDIAPGAVTSRAIRNGGVQPGDLSAGTRALLQAGGLAGAKGETGSAGANGANGANGAHGANGPNGANGANGVDGTDGVDGTNGTDGIDGTIAPCRPNRA
jgi:hypothetical protein